MLLVPRIFLSKHLPAGPGGEEEGTWSGLALSSPAGLTPPHPLAPHPVRVPHTLAQLGRDVQPGQASLGTEAQSTTHPARQQHTQTRCESLCSLPGTVPRHPRAGSPGTAWPGTSSTWNTGQVGEGLRGAQQSTGGCGDGCGAAEPCPALPAPAWSRPAEPAALALTQAPAPAQQGDPSGARVLLTVLNIPGN